MTPDERFETNCDKADMERETAIGFCSWCDGWYDRATGQPVKCDKQPVSHGVCPPCADKAIEESKNLNRNK
jgi:hypothetical protein